METASRDSAGGRADTAHKKAAAGLVDRVRDLIHVLVNTIQAARLFPPDHQTVVSFVEDLYARLSEYLEEHGELEIGVEEQSLTFAGQVVHEDPTPAKSLPFFFFKDGLTALVFCRGLKKDEIKELLESIRQVSLLPAEEGDIVNALWEKDFANIRYLASDDYLESKIGQGRRQPEWTVDRQAMAGGRIDLSPEDLEDIRQKGLAGERGHDDSAWTAELAEDLGSAGDPAREAHEKREIDSLLAANRQASAAENYFNLFLDILYLEDRPEQFPGLKASIKQFHRELVLRRDFGRAAHLLESLADLKEKSGPFPGKKAALEAAIAEITGAAELADLEEAIRSSAPGTEEDLLPYLRLVGSPAARLIGNLYERARTPASREEALAALKKIGEESLSSLMDLVQESKPGLARQIIALVSGHPDKRVVPFLAGFLGYKDVSVRLEAVRALGRSPGVGAARVLLNFFSDEAESVRVASMESLGRPEREMVAPIIDQTGGVAGLRKRSLAEKRAVVSALGASGSKEACAWLRRVLEKPPFWPDRKHLELCLCAVEALAGMPLAEAEAALQARARKGRRQVREACQAALRRTPRASRT